MRPHGPSELGRGSITRHGICDRDLALIHLQTSGTSSSPPPISSRRPVSLLTRHLKPIAGRGFIDGIMPLLTNPLASAEQLSSRLSSNLPTEVLDAVFVATQCLTQAAGILLELPQSITAQANVVLTRYWVSEPLGAFEFSVRSPQPGEHE